MGLDFERRSAIRQYWAGIQRWSANQGLTKDEVHARLKDKLGLKHLSELKTAELSKLAYEIGVIADGGPGE